jgi:hypothetical protein
MDSKLIAERRQTLKHKEHEALQETQRLRTILASWPRRSADKARVGHTLRSWGGAPPVTLVTSLDALSHHGLAIRFLLSRTPGM